MAGSGRRLSVDRRRRLATSYLRGPGLVRLFQDDGHFYGPPSISSHGKFVTYISDRGGKREIWLQQVGAAPIQATHDSNSLDRPRRQTAFFAEGTRIVYTSRERQPARLISPGGKSVLFPSFRPTRSLWMLAGFDPAGWAMELREMLPW